MRCHFEPIDATHARCIRCPRKVRIPAHGDLSRVVARCRGPQGVGDLVSWGLHATGVAKVVGPCNGCDGRRQTLNGEKSS